MPIKEGLQLLVDIGLLDVILPFLLVFTIIFATLQRTRVLGEEEGEPKRRLNAMLAFVMGFFAVLATNLLNVINIIIGYFVLLLVIGLLLAMVFGLAGAESASKNKLLGALLIAFFLVFVFYGLSQAGIIDSRRFFSAILLPVIVLGVLALAIYFTVREGKPSERRQPVHPRQRAPQAPAGPPEPGAPATPQPQQQPPVSAEGEQQI